MPLFSHPTPYLLITFPVHPLPSRPLPSVVNHPLRLKCNCCFYCSGVINAAVPSSMTKDFLLIHSHTAVGHSKAVLSVFASESTLYSSSKGMFNEIIHCG